MKKLISFIAATALAASLLPNAFASEITDELDANYNGYVWKAVTDAGDFHNDENQEAGGMFSYEFVDDPDLTSDENGSVKVTWTGTENTDGNLVLNVPDIEQKDGMAVKAVSIDVYVPETVGDDEAENMAIGSEFYCYSNIIGGGYQNGFYNKAAPRVVEAGWNTLVFDTTNADKVYFFVWRNTNKGGEIYIDNMRAYYQTPTSAFDSFEDYTVDWNAGAYTLSTNTDMAYVKDGKASLKVENTENKTGENYVIVSKFLNIGGNDGKNGKQIPLINGYTAKTVGFWVYSDSATGLFKLGGGTVAQSFDDSGWQYVAWSIPESGNWYDWTKEHFNQLVLKFETGATIYMDAMSIGYEDNSVTYIDGFESFLWTAGGCYGASGYGMNTNPEYVTDGLASGKFVIPAGKTYDDGEYVYSNNGFGISIPAAPEGQELKKIGMWVYGTGKAGTSLRPTFHTTGDDASTSYRPAVIDLSLEGWQYIEIELSPETTKLYNIQGKNDTNEDIVFYIDKITAIYGNANSAVWNSSLKNGTRALDLETLQAGDVLNFNVDITKSSSEMNYPICLYVAAYDGDGGLLKVGTQMIEASETGEISKTVSLTVDSEYEAEVISRVSGFVWKADTNTMEPLVNTTTVTK